MSYILLKDGNKYEFSGMELMGIVNVTPDSFFAGSRAGGTEEAVARGLAMVREGASIIDIGGESTRPGAAPVTEEEEIRRVCPVVSGLKASCPDVLISVDTYHAKTAAAAMEAGADIINDISAMTFDEDMAGVVAKGGVPVVLMHTGGRPETMQADPRYDDVVEDVYRFLEERIRAAIDAGIRGDRIIIDLGIGFGKTAEHNLKLLQNIDRFRSLGMPHLMAVSRKSVIGAVLAERGADGQPAARSPEGRLAGTIAMTLYGRAHGIEMARVHDVRENADALRMAEALKW